MTAAAVRALPTAWDRAGAAAFAAMAVALMAIPLIERGERAGFTVVVVVGLFVASTCFTAAAIGMPAALTAAAVIALFALAVEIAGSSTGFPFGEYDYTGVLQPTIAGVPVVVPLAWFAMGAPAWEVARQLARGTAARVAVGAVALTAWDLFLDPQMIDEGYWRWEGNGFYRSVPLSNFAGWLAASLVVMAVLAVADRRERPVSVPLLVAYSFMAVMETFGFLAFFGDPLVGVVGGVAMLPMAWFAWRARA